MLTDKKIYIAGHRGMVGSALVRKLQSLGCNDLILRSSDELDLRDQEATNRLFEVEQPDVVIFAAAKVGGIHANHSYPAEFLYDNLMMATNAIQAAYEFETERFLFLGSTCIYPRMAPQPIPESALLTSELEPTNEAYALAKIAGLKMCQYYRQEHGVMFHSAMPTNMYGPGDNYHPENSHVIPGLITRIHNAKLQKDPSVVVWGSGKPMREFLHVDDMAAASIHVMDLDKDILDDHINPMLSHINIGSGEEYSINSVVTKIAEIIGYQGKIIWDHSKPDGTPRKLLDTSLINDLGWKPRLSFDEGIKLTYEWFKNNTKDLRC